MSETFTSDNVISETKDAAKARQIASMQGAIVLDVDTATYCKIENENYSPRVSK